MRRNKFFAKITGVFICTENWVHVAWYSMSNNYTLNEEQLTPSRLYTRMKLFERRQYSSSHLSRAHILTQPISLSLSLFRTRIIISIHNAFIALSQLLPINTTKIALVCIALIRLTLYSHCNLNWKLYTNTHTRT